MSEDWRNHLERVSAAGFNLLSSFLDDTANRTVFSVLHLANHLAEVLSSEWKPSTSVLCAYVHNSRAFFTTPSAATACAALAAVCPPTLVPVLQQIARVCSASATPGDVIGLVHGLQADTEPAAEVVARLHGSVRDFYCSQGSLHVEGSRCELLMC
jgi:hypothetical protein